jgi:hypothetical protein
VDHLLGLIDPFLIFPYRLFEAISGNPLAAWWAGTFVLALWAALLGKATSYLAGRLNGSAHESSAREAFELSQRSLHALKAGDKESYRAINDLANDAYGRSFFQRAAISASSLWPAFLGAAWLEARFGEIRFSIPWMEEGLNFVAPYIICYIGARMALGRILSLRRRLPDIT